MVSLSLGFSGFASLPPTPSLTATSSLIRVFLAYRRFPCRMLQLDSLCPRRDAAQQHEARVVGQLLTLLDGAAALNPPRRSRPQQPAQAQQQQEQGQGRGQQQAVLVPVDSSDRDTSDRTSSSNSSDSSSSGAGPGHILVVGATTRPNAVDPALRRPGRYARPGLLPLQACHALPDSLRLSLTYCAACRPSPAAALGAAG